MASGIVPVKVFLNVETDEGDVRDSPLSRGYRNGDRVRLVAEDHMQMDFNGESVMKLLENVFDQGNGYGSHGVIQSAFMAGTRSLSVGDIVVVGETAYAVCKAGWAPVSMDSASVVQR